MQTILGNGGPDLDLRIEYAQKGWTNNVELWKKSARKEFRWFRAWSAQFGYNVYKLVRFSPNLRYLSIEKRMENERVAREIFSDNPRLRDTVFGRAPALTQEDSERRTQCYERFRGYDLRTFMQTNSKEKIAEAAHICGEDIRTLHECDYAVLDSTLFDFLVPPDGDLRKMTAIDFEFFIDGPDRVDRQTQLGITRASMKLLPPNRYRVAADAFDEGYGAPTARWGFETYYLAFENLRQLLRGNRQAAKNGIRNNWEDTRLAARKLLPRAETEVTPPANGRL